MAPMLLVGAVTAWAMAGNVIDYVRGELWLLAGSGSLILVLDVWVTLEGLRGVGQRLKHGFCDACFSDAYPVELGEEGPPPQLSLFRPVELDDDV